MFQPPTFVDTLKRISSLELGGGPMHSDKPAGPMIDLFGQEVAPASPSPQQGKAKDTRTSATYGRTGIGSSASVALQSALVSRLMPRLEQAGSTMFAYRLNRLVTPSGRSVFRLAASARRTSGSDFTSWPTATVHDADRGGQGKRAMGDTRHGSNLQDFALLTGWPTPQSHDDRERGNTMADNHSYPHDLPNMVAWATPTGLAPATENYNAAGNSDGLRKMTEQARPASWATPTNRDFKSTEGSQAHYDKRAEESRGKPPSAQAHQLAASGPTPNGSPVGTAKAGQLNPELPRWLQGLPLEWSSCADTAIASMPKRRKPSSKPT